MIAPYFSDSDLTLYQGDAVDCLQPCACGCGELVRNPDARGRPRKYRRGHSLRVDASAQADAARRTWTGRKHSDETRAKLSKAASVPKPYLRGARNGMAGRTGASNPNWKGGVSPERQRLYSSYEWREVVRAVKRRDGGCVECHSSHDLHVHHIRSFAEFPSLRLEALNLETLCRPCHYAKHRKGVTL